MIVKGWKGEDVVIRCGCGHDPREEHRNELGAAGPISGCKRCSCEATPMMAGVQAGRAVLLARSLGILPPVGYVAPKLCKSCELTLDDKGQCPFHDSFGGGQP